jgi:inorganic pyrophosphatase
MSEVDVIIEIAKGSHIKYEYDKDRNMIVCDRVLHTPMKYPFNYGFIPNTLSEDGDPLDVVVLMDDELIPGCIIRCKILGYLDTKDDAGNDPKLIVCPIVKVDPMWKNIDDLLSINNVNLNYTQDVNYLIEYINNNSLSYKDNCGVSSLHINPVILTRIKYFFEHYKDLENKKVEVGSFYNKEEALKIFHDSIVRCKSTTNHKSKITDFFAKI